MNRFGSGSLLAWILLVWAALSLVPEGAIAAGPEPGRALGVVQADAVDVHAGAQVKEPPVPTIVRRAAEAGESESLGWTLVRTFLTLGVIVVLIYITLNFGLRRLMSPGGFQLRRPGVLKVVERVTLDSKRTLFVVRAAGQYLLVGGGEGALSLITALNAQEVERVLELDKPLRAQPGPFLQKLLSRNGPGATGQKGVT